MLNTSNISTYWHSSGIPVLWLSKFKLDKNFLWNWQLNCLQMTKNYTWAPGRTAT
jgi:hypothetical protein